MKKRLAVSVLLATMSVSLYAASGPAEIKIRDVDLDGLLVMNSRLSLTATFDVKKESIFDEVTFDFYLLLSPRDKDMGKQFFHCQTIHRYIEENSGYTSGVNLGPDVLKCIQPRDSKFAVVVTYGGKEVDVDNSEDDRWWEDASLGQPIEHVLGRFGSVPVVRVWESGK